VIWPEQYDPKTSAIDALNDIDVKPMKIRIIIAATCAALAFSMAGPVRLVGPCSLSFGGRKGATPAG
jgi:hypothetical protein